MPYYDINNEKTTKLMAITKYHIDNILKPGLSNTIFLEKYIKWHMISYINASGKFPQ